MLTEEGIAYFKVYVQGKKPGDLMFQHISIKRRKEYANPLAWAENDQIHAMEATCAASGVEPVTFHELRHTYASHHVDRQDFLRPIWRNSLAMRISG